MPGVRCWSPRFLQAPGRARPCRGRPRSSGERGGGPGPPCPGRSQWGEPTGPWRAGQLANSRRLATRCVRPRRRRRITSCRRPRGRAPRGRGAAPRRWAAGVSASVVADLRLPGDRRADLVERRARVEGVEAHLAGLVEVPDAEVRDDHRRPAADPAAARAGSRSACSAPPRLPGEVRKSIRSTNERDDWRMITNTLRALIAISHAPPEPGSRVVGAVVVADDRRVDVAEPVDLGRAQEPDVDQAALQVEARTARTSRRPRWRRSRSSGRRWTAAAAPAAPRTRRPRRRARAPGATVRLARLTAMFGSPTPTKQTRCPASSRAAATIIISDLEKPASRHCAGLEQLDRVAVRVVDAGSAGRRDR